MPSSHQVLRRIKPHHGEDVERGEGACVSRVGTFLDIHRVVQVPLRSNSAVKAPTHGRCEHQRARTRRHCVNKEGPLGLEVLETFTRGFPPRAGLVDTQHTTHAWDPTRPSAPFWFSRFLTASRIFVDFKAETDRQAITPSQYPSINFDLSLRSRASRRRCPRSSPATSPATAGQFPALFKNT